jgi:prepilin signal peptidase PulO-like enzyme (type II secretory pathway)
LNVVIYRVPRDISLSYPESRCPSCGKSIRWHHNLPIVGYLMLRGRCADCRSKISPRYPFVETLVGVLFVAIALVDLRWQSQPLPDGSAIPAIDPLDLLPYARDLCLLCTLFVCAWIQFDGHAPPLRLFGWCLTLLVFTWALHVVVTGFSVYGINWRVSFLNALLGALGGLMLGYALAWSSAAVDRQLIRPQVIFATTLIGAAVGPIGVIMIATLTSLAQLVESMICLLSQRRRRLGAFVWLFAGTLVWMLAAGPLDAMLALYLYWVVIPLACLVPLWLILAALIDLQYQHERPPA